MTEALVNTAAGGILYDTSRIGEPADELFETRYWQSRNALEVLPGGRGGVAFLKQGAQTWVLRHYRRGGRFAEMAGDRYFWQGADRTRSFREWRLLAELDRLGLPAPKPVAARYWRGSLTYRADLITERLPATQSLSLLMRGALPDQLWNSIGRCIAGFHRHGVHHADLNAHNIMIDAQQRVYLLDFDRGRIRARGSWESAVLSRLHRSLLKIQRTAGGQFDAAQWQALMQGYSSES